MKKIKHQHGPETPECAHIVKFCKHCDVVYCEKCDKEWKSSSNLVDILKDYKPKPYNDPGLYPGYPRRDVFYSNDAGKTDLPPPDPDVMQYMNRGTP